MSEERTPPTARRLRELARRGIHAPRWPARWWVVVALLAVLAPSLWRHLVQATIGWIEVAVIAPGSRGPDLGAVDRWALWSAAPVVVVGCALMGILAAVRLMAGAGPRNPPLVDARDAVLRTALVGVSLGFSGIAAWYSTDQAWAIAWLSGLATLHALDVWRQRAAFDRLHGMTDAERRAEARDEAAPAATRRRPGRSAQV